MRAMVKQLSGYIFLIGGSYKAASDPGRAVSNSLEITYHVL